MCQRLLPSSALLLSLLLSLLLWLLPVRPAAAQDWEQVAAGMLQRPEFETLPLQILPPRGQSLGGSPVEMQFQSGQCLLKLRTRGNPVAEWLLAQALPEDRTLWMQTVLVHEIAHCWRWQQGHDPSLQAPAQEEAFADVAALAWVAGVAPQRFEAMLQAFLRLRSDQRLSFGHHDTRAALRQVQRQGVATDRPAFLSASALLQAP